jgi:hypothetical protein
MVLYFQYLNHIWPQELIHFFFARLIEDNQYMGGYTNLEGKPILFNDISNEFHKAKIKQTLATRINHIQTTMKQIFFN